MATNDLPTVTHTGILKLGAFECPVHNLDDGRRVIDPEAVERFLVWLGEGHEPPTFAEIQAFARAVKGGL